MWFSKETTIFYGQEPLKSPWRATPCRSMYVEGPKNMFNEKGKKTEGDENAEENVKETSTSIS